MIQLGCGTYCQVSSHIHFVFVSRWKEIPPMGRTYKKVILIGLAFVLALSFVAFVVPPTDVQASAPYGYGNYHGYMYKNMGKK